METAINCQANAVVTCNQRHFGRAPGSFEIYLLFPSKVSVEDQKEEGTSINQFIATAVEKLAGMDAPNVFKLARFSRVLKNCSTSILKKHSAS